MGIDSIEPQAAWYLLFDFTPLRYHKKLTKIKNSVELSKHLVEELGMIFVPGSAFGFEPEKFILRASLVDIDPQGAQDWVRSIDLQDQQLSPEQIVKKHPLKDLAWARKVETSLTMLGQWLAEK